MKDPKNLPPHMKGARFVHEDADAPVHHAKATITEGYESPMLKSLGFPKAPKGRKK